jgi:3',5'-nucleoside bisphosphate phosphatase
LPVDLHTHTTASDGAHPARVLVRMARDKGLQALAITDHDTTDALDEAIAAGQEMGVEVVPAVEMSTDVAESEIHIVGFFINHHDEKLQALLSTLREARVGRAHKMVDKLAALGMSLDWARVQSFAGDGAVGRPHVAKAMVEAGYVPDIKTAFDRYINRNGPAYVERYKLTPVEAVQVIRGVGGLAVLAHPLDGTGSVPMIPELAAAGLGGMECYYTGYTADQVTLLETIARKYGLAPSGGSDFHGEGVAANAILGQPVVPYRVLANLRAAWKKRMAKP